MFRILLSILFCFLLTTQCCAKDILLKRCQDDRIVLIIGVADKNHIAYGHGFIVGKNKIITATHILNNNFKYVFIDIKGKARLISQNQVKYLTNTITTININTEGIAPYPIGTIKKGDRIKINNCVSSSSGQIFGVANNYLISDSFIAKGWSGSPVLNSKGEAVGIVEALINLNGDEKFSGASILTRIDKSCKVKF